MALALVCSFFCAGVLHATAYVGTLGNVLAASVSGDTLTLTVDNGTEPGDDILELQVCEADILKVNYRPNGIASSASTPMIDPNRVWQAVGAQIDASGDPIIITTEAMQISIQRTPCRMTVKKADGTVLFWEPESGGVFHDGVRFVRSAGQNMYGLSSYACFDGNGQLLRNDTSAAVQAGQQGNSGGPFVWSTAGYGLLIDSDGGYPVVESTSGKLEFYYGDTTTEGRRYFKNNVEYYVLLGEPEDIMENYAHVTGESPMMPEWSLGFSNYEWGINQAELYTMIDTYRAKGIPLDSYGIDYDWKNYGSDNYAAAKGGLKMLTRNICSEFGSANIQCNAIGPGYIATQQTAPLRERQPDGSRHPFDQFIISKTPAGRWGTTDDLIGPAVFLASDASDFVNGHVLYVDGGILAYIGKQP